MNAPDFFDKNNPLLAQVSARLDTGTITEPGESPRAVLTIRTASTTMTVVLGSDDLNMWVDILTKLADSLHGPANMPQRRVQPANILDVMRLGKDGKVN